MTPESILQYPHATPPAAGETLEVAPGVFWLRMALPFALDHINLWLLRDGDGWTIVDCGIGNDATRDNWEQIIRTRIGDQPVKRVILTHHHPDHAGLASWLLQRFPGAEMWMTQTEYLAAHALREGRAGYGAEHTAALFARNGLDGERLAALGRQGNRYLSLVPDFPRAYHRLLDGAVQRVGGHDWRMMVGYGHSPEHASLYCESLGVLISGDMLLPRISTNVSVPAIEPHADALGLFLASLERYLPLPARTLVLPSHGLPFRGMNERIAQLQEHHKLRLEELLEACEAPKAAAEVLGVLFRRQLDTHQTFFAMGEAMAHLHYLHLAGRLVRSEDADRVLRYVRA
jgi:glyoxylase-like metal-dependent hydrolase (beta-lactamase superfamily II)